MRKEMPYLRDVVSALKQGSVEMAKLVPEFAPCIGFNQNNRYHSFSVDEHMRQALNHLDLVEIGLEFDREAVAATLAFHDIGKPAAYSEEIAEGAIRGHFYGHPKVSAAICKTVFERFGDAAEFKQKVIQLVEFHDIIITPSAK